MEGRNNKLDYLKGISILTIILYHIGILKSGFLGVDIFFAINGFLLVPKIIENIDNNNFKYDLFLKKRLLRIYPLVVFVSLVSMAIGILTMLPDDLENLSESVVASLVCSNNILSYITVNSYWDMSNELKPLMHLWYIGILVKFYILFPLILIVIKKVCTRLKIDSKKILISVVVLLWFISLVFFFFFQLDANLKFYFLPFRLFEILSGGLSEFCIRLITKQNIRKSLNHKIYLISNVVILLLLICGLLSTDFSQIGNEVVAIGSNAAITNLILPNDVLVMTIVFFTCIVLITGNYQNNINNKVFNLISSFGVASYSIYIWHQPIIAFYRYTKSCVLDIESLLFYVIFISGISYLSYRFLEKHIDSNLNLLSGMKRGGVTITACLLIGALLIYNNAGVVRDIPELNVSLTNAHRGMNSEYVDRIYNYNKDFTKSDTKKVLLIGNSYARDWGNILLESVVANKIEISYIDNLDISYLNRIKDSDYIFVYSLKSDMPDFFWDVIDSTKTVVYGIGTKNFGRTMGEIYSKRFLKNYYSETIELDKAYIELNQQMSAEWQNNYIDLLQVVEVENYKIRIFTDNNKYISPDGYHLTSSGAKYFAEHINISELLFK